MRTAAAALTLIACAAWADIPPPNSSSCRDAKPGAKCKSDEGKAGTCAKSTCSRNDYSEGPPPKSVSYECLVCATAADGGVKK